MSGPVGEREEREDCLVTDIKPVGNSKVDGSLDTIFSEFCVGE